MARLLGTIFEFEVFHGGDREFGLWNIIEPRGIPNYATR